jgi:hypothetical protein
MQKRFVTILVSIFLVLGTAILVAAFPLPTPNSSGDYSRSPHTTWQVVDNDPKGLSCRMGKYSYEQIIDPRSSMRLNIVDWPVVGIFKRGQNFEIELGPAGFGILKDNRNKPWIFVKRSSDKGAPKNCFVRANSSFVRPVQSLN